MLSGCIFLLHIVNALMGFAEIVEKLHQRFIGVQTPQEVRQVIRSGLGGVDNRPYRWQPKWKY